MTYSQVIEIVRQMVGRVLRFSYVAGTSSDGNGDSVEGRVSDPSDMKSPYGVRRMWPFGIRSRPPVGTDAIMIFGGGGSSNAVMLAAESAKYGPSGLNDGETAIYNKVTGVLVLLDQNGAITATDQGGAQIKLDGTGAVSITTPAGKGITLTAGAGANVVVNGGVNNVARATVDTAGPYPIVGGAPFFKG